MILRKDNDMKIKRMIKEAEVPAQKQKYLYGFGSQDVKTKSMKRSLYFYVKDPKFESPVHLFSISYAVTFVEEDNPSLIILNIFSSYFGSININKEELVRVMSKALSTIESNEFFLYENGEIYWSTSSQMKSMELLLDRI